MSHEIDMSNGRANMAYIGDKPWHSLGEDMVGNEGDLDKWRIAAGLNHNVEARPCLYMSEEGSLIEVPNRRVLVRDDTGFVLSVVSDTYNIVQPMEVIEFYRSLIENQGFEMETAGSLMNGKRVWALARTGTEARIKGQDLLKQYVLFATAYDGTMATVASATVVRVVCWNTFSYAVGANGERADVRIPHHSVVNPDKIKAEMGLEENAWSKYIEEANELADRKVNRKEAIDYFLKLFYGDEEEIDAEDKKVQRRLNTILEVYDHGVGQDVQSAKGTAWGLVNAVTRFYDHERSTRSDDSRLNSAWFGDGERMKVKAFNNALKLVA